MIDKEKFMKEALKEAKKAYQKGEVPVGAVIVKDNKIIARAHNQKEEKNNPIMHAEINAIMKACKKLNSWRLEGAEIYVTLEPCMMCASAIVAARMKKVYIGNLLEQNNEFKVSKEEGILKEDCQEIIKKFFKELRNKS